MDTNTLIGIYFLCIMLTLTIYRFVDLKLEMLKEKKESVNAKLKAREDAMLIVDKIFEMLCNQNIRDSYIWIETGVVEGIQLSKKNLIKKGRYYIKKKGFQLCFSYKKREDETIQVVARVEENGFDIYIRSAIVKDES